MVTPHSRAMARVTATYSSQTAIVTWGVRACPTDQRARTSRMGYGRVSQTWRRVEAVAHSTPWRTRRSSTFTSSSEEAKAARVSARTSRSEFSRQWGRERGDFQAQSVRKSARLR